MSTAHTESHPPEILAPAGNRDAFLAALAAGADAVYCGLKTHSARMTAKNFSIEELCRITQLAHEKHVRVYVTLNTLIKTGETADLAALLQQLLERARPDGLIIQDLAVVELVRQLGSDVEIHLSTLANVGFPAALRWLQRGLNISRVVVPREMSIDEIKTMADQCPPELSLEVFIHGALCYAVSGRCYWSSLLGGRSGLRGRCVQPCRRRYTRQGQTQRLFSCQDLSLDVLVKTLRPVRQIRAWKIEGRKKGAHYVYHTVAAYRMLRDLHPDAPDKSEVKKAALNLLGQALGRTGTHYHFLPQRPQNPVQPDAHSGSGLLVGVVKGSVQRRFFNPRVSLMPGDVIRMGYEDDRWHQRIFIRQSVPARGRFQLKPASGRIPPNGTPLFLVDRRDRFVYDQIAAFTEQLKAKDCPSAVRTAAAYKRPVRRKPRHPLIEMQVYRHAPRHRHIAEYGLWLPDDADRLPPIHRGARLWWWLSPAVWPDAETRLLALIHAAVERGAAGFVLNSPWQAALFSGRKSVPIWAGPFCNVANEMAIASLARLGFAGVVVSPELGRHELLALPAVSPVPLGIVTGGHWPFCIVRRTAQDVQPRAPFTSPRGETAWMAQYGDNYWMFPNWSLNLRDEKKRLKQAGYHLLIDLVEPQPAGIETKRRPGIWNWDVGLA